MICYRCNGTGEYDIYNECPVCDGTGEIEITNEEWLAFLSTEEKAKWLSRHSQFMYECGQKQVAPKIMYEEDWEWWLKQPHNP